MNTENKKSRFRLNYYVPYAYHLIFLWMLLFLKTVEAISLYAFNLHLKTLTSAVFVGGFILTYFYKVEPREHKSRFVDITWLIPLISGFATVWTLRFLMHYFARFNYHVSVRSQLIVSLLFLLLSASYICFQHRINKLLNAKILYLLVAYIAFSIVWAVTITGFPLDAERSDMLPLIVSANKSFFLGDNPYRWHIVGEHQLPLTYLPLMWVGYAPFVALELDPRWLLLPAHLVLMTMLWFSHRPFSDNSWWTYLAWMTLNPFLFIRHEIQAYLLWPILALTLYAMTHNRWRSSSFLWAMLIVTRKTMWIIFPFYLLFLLYERGWRVAIQHFLAIIVVVSLIAGPFIIQDPNAFYDGIVGYFQSIAHQLPSSEWPQIAGWATGFSFVPLLYRLGFVEYIQTIQMSSVMISFGVAVWMRPKMAGLLKLMSATLLLFLLFNPLVWVYMYAPVLFLLAFSGTPHQEIIPDRPVIAV